MIDLRKLRFLFLGRAWLRLVLFVLPTWVAACGMDSASDVRGDHEGDDPALDSPLDAGLSADARLEDCVSDDGVRLCGYAAGCYESGPPCDCVAFGLDNAVPDISICSREFSLSGPCGHCRDGEVCLSHFRPISLSGISFCVSESLGHLYWLHGAGDRVTYADSTPYTGEPVPRPVDCPPPIGDIVLCGGNCGGCGGSNKFGSHLSYCSGRSPTHPWGICVEYDNHCLTASDCSPDEACLVLTTEPQQLPVLYPTLCVKSVDCAALASSIPGGARCN